MSALCGWTGVPDYVGTSPRGWGVGAAGMYADQKWCKACRVAIKPVRAEIDGAALDALGSQRARSISQPMPPTPRPGESFADAWPEFAKFWVTCAAHPSVGPTHVSKTAAIDIEWRCPVRGHRNFIDQPEHVHALLRKEKRPCPFCRAGLKPDPWTRERVLELVESIGPYIETLSSADRYVLLLQTGILDSSGSWAGAVADALLDARDAHKLKDSLAALTTLTAESERLLGVCLNAVRRLVHASEWGSEATQREAVKRASRRTGAGLADAIAHWATNSSPDWRAASVRKAKLAPSDVAALYRGAPLDACGDELRRCLVAGSDEPHVLTSIAPTGIAAPESALRALRTRDEVDTIAEHDDGREELPRDDVTDILAASDRLLIADEDQDALEYFLASQVGKLWALAFDSPRVARAEAERWQGRGFGQLVRTRFLDELAAVETFEVPSDWRFAPKGSHRDEPTPPRPMQSLTAIRLLRATSRGVGNWSLMGGGKTVSAVLSAAALGARLAQIVCPNPTVEGWCNEISRVFPDAAIETGWQVPAAARRRFIVLNVEQFQQATSPERIDTLLAAETPDFVVLDEVHKFKQRDAALTRRRQCLLYLLGAAAERNPALRILAMTGTPVINNLFEARSLIELCTLSHHADLDTRPSVANAMKVHARLARLGLRYRPDYTTAFGGIERVAIDVTSMRAELVACADRLAAELLLLRAKTEAIAEHATPRTVVYCELVEGVHAAIARALTAKGLRVGFYNGPDKSGLDLFNAARIDCLIASSAIGTGIDGLQYSTERLIIATLPWTASDYDQLLGRFFRPKSDGTVGHVRVVVPWTSIPDPARVDGEWSLDGARWRRSRYKASLADTAVDGVLPQGELRSPDQAFEDLQAWLRRLNERSPNSEHVRPSLTVERPTDADVPASTSELVQFHARLARSTSATTHARMRSAPEEWRRYHAQVAEAAESWPFRPVERCRAWIERRIARRGAALVVADLGCGLAVLQASLRESCRVLSFDHVGAHDGVVVANIAEHVPLADESVDIAVLSLAADWQSDWGGCVREAARILAVDGQLLFWETPTFIERVGGLSVLTTAFASLGLTVVQTLEERFVGLVATKL